MNALLIAAGASSRMGMPKQLLPWGDDCLLQSRIELLNESGFSVTVVLGAHHEKIQNSICHCQVVVNPEWKMGMGQSIRFGITSVKPGPVMIVLGDQLGLEKQHYLALKTCFEKNRSKIICCDYVDQQNQQKVYGAPAIFPDEKRFILEQLQGDQGARKWLRKLIHNDNNQEVLSLHLPQAAININTIEDWQSWQKNKEELINENAC